MFLKNKAVVLTNEMLKELIVDMDLQEAACCSIEDVIKAIIKIWYIKEVLLDNYSHR